MRCLKAVLLLFLIHFQYSIYAAEVKGNIKKETGEPYASQSVYLSNGITATTNKEGNFVFQDLLPGSYELTIQLNGQNVFLSLFTITNKDESIQLGQLYLAKNIQLQETAITAPMNRGIERMPDVKENVIYAGKKTEVIRLSTSSANLAQNNSRQLFAKVPGVQVWESDGSGVQMGIASRGLSPNRMWEFNTRQNGYDISADPYGYPEAYYTPSVESLDRIEVIRGAASLQFGPQFGGVVNYIKKRSVSGKKIGVESMQTYGSNGLFSSFNAIGGNINKFSYYANMNYRKSDGWRENNGYNTWNGFVNLGYQLNSKMSISAEYTKMDQLVQQPGGLTDSMFKADAQQSARSRNWFDLKWNIAAINFNYAINAKNQLNIKAFGLFGDRSSIGFTQPIFIPDTISTKTGTYGNRTIDRDVYTNYGIELRHLYTYSLFKQKSNLAFGAKLYSGHTDRIQNAYGNRGVSFDLAADSTKLKRDMNYYTQNLAFFAENLFTITNRLSITPGIRVEYLKNQSNGIFDGKKGDQSSDRQFVLLGLGSQFKVSGTTQLYANFSQAYRPILFSDITPATTDSIDPNLSDAKGYNLDLGYRGNIGNVFNFDVTAFLLHYDNRIGSYAVNAKNYRTNIGNSVSKGIESYMEFTPTALMPEFKGGQISIFAALSFIDARYTKWNNPDKTKDQTNKLVENAPQQIHRLGIHYRLASFATSFQYSIAGVCYSDALNTTVPNHAATIGEIPQYEVADWSASYTLKKLYQFNMGINNVFNKAYFTRRSGGYPGPGLLPAEGRTWYIGLGIKF